MEKSQSQKDGESGKFEENIWDELDLCRKLVISVNYGFSGGVMTVTNVKSSAESETFILKIRSESGNLFTIGCNFPPKATNFRTLCVVLGSFSF